MDNSLSIAERNARYTPSVDNIIKAWHERKRAGREINIERLGGRVQRNPNWPEIWSRFIGKSGTTWWIPVGVPNRADYIHCRNMNVSHRSEGYGGRTFKFKCEDGTVDKPQGPWHSNSDSLFLDAGVDIRNEHITCGVVFMSGHYGNVRDVIYADKEPEVGSFHRIDMLATRIADAVGFGVMSFSESDSGSHCGMINPGDIQKNRLRWNLT